LVHARRVRASFAEKARERPLSFGTMPNTVTSSKAIAIAG
jgi:hypothetical protein